MIRNGTGPVIQDLADYSFHPSFGTIGKADLPSQFTVDIGLTMPNQNADGLFYGCTGYTVTDIATDQDKRVYNPRFTYEKTCYMEGHPMDRGCQIRTAIKSSRVYGLQWGNETEEQSTKNRRGAYFNVYDDGGMNWFDSFKSSIFINKRGLVIGTPFFNEWTTAPNGIIPSVFVYDGIPEHYSWHCWAIKGWKTIDGIEYLICKMWLGKNYGDGGWCYIDRQTINKVMAIRGCAAFTFAEKPVETRTIQIDIFETIVTYLYRLLNKTRYA